MSIPQAVYDDYLKALLDGDRERCAGIVKTILASGDGVRALYENLFQRALYDVGDLWERNRVSVATEHLATSMTESLMVLAYPKLSSHPRQEKRAVICCPANEHHQIGARMVADMLEMRGWDTWFLGSNVPPDAIVAQVRLRKADLLALSLSVYFNLPQLLGAIRQTTIECPELNIMVGGQAFRHGGREALVPCRRVEYVGSLENLENHRWVKANP